MRSEWPGVIPLVVSLFVVVRDLEVVIYDQAVRDEQVVRLVSGRRELLLGVDRNRGDKRERARDVRRDPCVEQETNGTSIAVTQQPRQCTQTDCGPTKKDDRTVPDEENVRNGYRQPREQDQQRPYQRERDTSDTANPPEQDDAGCRRKRQQPERCEKSDPAAAGGIGHR